MNKKISAIAAAWLFIAPTLLCAQSGANQTDSVTKPVGYGHGNYDYAKSQASYHTSNYRYDYRRDPAYKPEAMRARAHRDSLAQASVITDMIKDGLITNSNSLTFTMTNKEFIVNGTKQDDAIFQRYKQKYVPTSTGNGEWSWTCSLNQLAIQKN